MTEQQSSVTRMPTELERQKRALAMFKKRGETRLVKLVEARIAEMERKVSKAS